MNRNKSVHRSRMTGRYSLSSLICLLLLLASAQAIAGIRPSFLLDYSAWHSTDIVVATEGTEIDGNLTVLEVWKGDLKPGAMLSIPELAAFAPLEKRLVLPEYQDHTANAPTFITGSRMVLFLKKPQTPQGRWQSADLFGEMGTSVAWIEQGYVHVFHQVFNPGPSVLFRYPRWTEQGMKAQVLSIDRTQNQFQAAIANPNLMLRADSLEPFMHSDIYEIQHDALEALSHCGRPALPILRKMLQDKTLAGRHDVIVTALGTVGGKSVGPELMGMVASELAFWRKTGPSLQPGWWSGDGLPASELKDIQDHIAVLYRTLCALADMKYQGDTKVVADLRDYWRSLLQREDKSRQNEISQECDVVLGQAVMTK